MDTLSAIFSMIMLSIGLSMDSLALSVSCGLQKMEHKLSMALKVALIFAFIQATNPVIGYFVGIFFAEQIAFIDHWIAFVLLFLIGSNMIKEGVNKNNRNTSIKNGRVCEERRLTIWVLITMGIATSIDALAAGISLIATDLNIPLTIFIIFIGTFLFSIGGFSFGHKLGALFQSKAEIFGGIVLVSLGIKILVEHLFLF
ncbi:MAG: manganese efflux pump MntP [Promethearchaeota archaeon]